MDGRRNPVRPKSEEEVRRSHPYNRRVFRVPPEGRNRLGTLPSTPTPDKGPSVRCDSGGEEGRRGPGGPPRPGSSRGQSEGADRTLALRAAPVSVLTGVASARLRRRRLSVGGVVARDVHSGVGLREVHPTCVRRGGVMGVDTRRLGPATGTGTIRDLRGEMERNVCTCVLK